MDDQWERGVASFLVKICLLAWFVFVVILFSVLPVLQREKNKGSLSDSIIHDNPYANLHPCSVFLNYTDCITQGYHFGIHSFCLQKFQLCEFAKTKLFKTEGRGWGLLADQSIKVIILNKLHSLFIQMIYENILFHTILSKKSSYLCLNYIC